MKRTTKEQRLSDYVKIRTAIENKISVEYNSMGKSSEYIKLRNKRRNLILKINELIKEIEVDVINVSTFRFGG